MQYEPTDHLDAARLPDVVQGLQREDVLVDGGGRGAAASAEDSSRVNSPAKNERRRQHLADVATAALYLSCGGTNCGNVSTSTH